MKRLVMSLVMLFVLGAIAWGETYIVDGKTESGRLNINATGYDAIVFRNSKFEETVIIAGNENLKILMIYNCDFADMVSVRNNSSLTTLAIASSNFQKHLLVNNNRVEGKADFTDNYIGGYFQFSSNQTSEKCSIDLSKVERGISCFENVFSSAFEISVTDFSLRSVFYGNSFNTFELNDVSFGMMLMHDNRLEKSMGFADCTITDQMTIRQLNDSGDPNSKRSISFYNTSVYGSVYLDEIDTTILLIDLWQLNFRQDIFIDYDRLTSSIGVITDRIIHSPQSIETVVITNPYKELSKEKTQKFEQLLSRIKSGYDKRGDRNAKINFIKWEYHYKNNFNNPFERLLKKILFYVSFEQFLNIYIPLVLSLVICIVFMFIYIRRDKNNKNHFIYLKIDKEKNTNVEQKVPYWFVRYLIAFMVSTSVFCNLPTTKKLREDDAKNITWIEGMIGLIILIIIGAIVGRIASI
jgi:hypothetical protein